MLQGGYTEMSFNLTVEEAPRKFDVKVGYKQVGFVKSHNYTGRKGSDDDDEIYYAVRMDTDEEEGKTTLGWFKTMEAAVKEIVEYDYGSSKITKIEERPV
jgi:hypothetical protein